MRIYAMSDIHGCRDKLARLHEETGTTTLYAVAIMGTERILSSVFAS